MRKSVLSCMKMSKERKDRIIGTYFLPLAIFVGCHLFGMLLSLASRYKKVEEFAKRVKRKFVWLLK